MRYSNLTRLTVLGTAAAACLATAAPASAHGSSTAGKDSDHKTSSTPSLAQVQAWVDSFIAKRQTQLTSLAAKVAADPKLTDAQKADLAAKIAAKQAVLASLKSAVDSATSVDAVHQAIKSAMSTDGVHGYFGWCGFFGGSQHSDALARHHDRGAKPDPGKATAPARAVHPVGVHTVAVRTSSHPPTLQPNRTASLHRSFEHGSYQHGSGSQSGYQARHSAPTGQHSWHH